MRTIFTVNPSGIVDTDTVELSRVELALHAHFEKFLDAGYNIPDAVTACKDLADGKALSPTTFLSKFDALGAYNMDQNFWAWLGQ